MLHRDIKPGNIILGRDGRPVRVSLDGRDLPTAQVVAAGLTQGASAEHKVAAALPPRSAWPSTGFRK